MVSIINERLKLVASDAEDNDNFGYSLSIDGDYAIVGSYTNSDGAAYIFKKNNNGTWSEQIKLVASDPDPDDNNDYFGYSVSISGNYAIVGAPQDSHTGTGYWVTHTGWWGTNQQWVDTSKHKFGSAYIFKKNDSDETWNLQARLRVGTRPDHRFGVSVSIDGDYAIIGAHDEWNNPRDDSAYIFKKSIDENNNEIWTQKVKLKPGPQQLYGYTLTSLPYRRFGRSVSISGNYAIVCALGRQGYTLDNGLQKNSAHSAFIFKKDDGAETWTMQDVVTGYSAHGSSTRNDDFGNSVSIHGNYAIVGAPGPNSSNTSYGKVAYIFKKDDGAETWSEQARLVYNNKISFGHSVDIKNDYAIVGCPDSAEIYTFEKSLDDNNNETWTQQSLLITGDGGNSGKSVSIDENGNFAMVGNPQGNGLYIFQLPNAKRAAALASAEAAKTNLRDNLGVAEDIINKMTTEVSVSASVATISNKVKNSIIKTSGGVKDTKRNIRKKRRDFFKILFADNLSESKIKIKAADIGLDETLNDRLRSRTVKENVTVLKKNESTPIVISTEVSEDTAIYSELDTLDDSVVFDVGVANKNVTVTKTRDEDGATTAQWTVSYDGNEYIKEEGDQITINRITFYIGSVYTDGSNSGINQNGPTSLADLYIPFVDDTNVVASNDAIRTKRHSRINNIFGNNPLDISFTALSTELGLDKTVGDKIKTNTKVLKANSTLDLDPATTDISNNLSAHVNIKAVGEYALIEGLTGGNFRIQVVADGEYQLRSEDGSTALVENKYKDGEQVTFRNVTFYFGSVTTNNSNDGISGDTVLDLASLNIRFDIEQLRDGQVQADEINNVAVVSDNGNKYSINSSTIPTLYLFKGKTYRFNQTDGTNGGHPMKLYLEADKTTEYSNGVDISGTPGTDGYLEITVADDAPEELHYQCGAHPDMGGVFKIVSVNNTITSLGSLNSIRSARHRQLRKIFNNNPSLDSITATTKDLGIDVTVGKTVKKQVIVYRANASSAVDLTDPSLITSKQGVYGDLKEVGDYLDFNTGHNNGAFRVKVNTTNPKTYVITNTVNDTKLLEPEFTDGQWITFRGVTLYFGGVYTSGTNDGITAADPYVFPINGNPYKLPDENANYCLYADNNTFITGTVSQLSKEKQEEMREWVIEKLGSDTNNGASLVTDGFFYSNLHINTTVGELVLDMESKVCNSNNVQGFKVKVNNSRDNTYLFKGEHKTTATISWEADGNIMSVDVDFFENPQIRNGIRMNTVVTKSNPIGLLVDDYEPSLLCVENSKNKLSMYNKLVNSLELGKRVKDDKLNLQKQGELWSRHTM